MATEQGFELTTCKTKLSLAHSGQEVKKKKVPTPSRAALVSSDSSAQGRCFCGHCPVGLQHASEMAHGSDNLSLILGTHRVQKTPSCKLSPNFHMCAHA